MPHLYGDEVLLLCVARTVDVGHPVAGPQPVHEVRQPALREHLDQSQMGRREEKSYEIFMDMGYSQN